MAFFHEKKYYYRFYILSKQMSCACSDSRAKMSTNSIQTRATTILKFNFAVYDNTSSRISRGGAVCLAKRRRRNKVDIRPLSSVVLSIEGWLSGVQSRNRKCRAIRMIDRSHRCLPPRAIIIASFHRAQLLSPPDANDPNKLFCSASSPSSWRVLWLIALNAVHCFFTRQYIYKVSQ